MSEIIGAGGGGKKSGGSAKTAKDSLDSTSFAKVLDLISEGEIEGVVNTIAGNGDTIPTGVFLNNTPVSAAIVTDGVITQSDNFEDVKIKFKTGTSSQSVITGFAEAASTTPVGVTVTKSGGGVVRTVATGSGVVGDTSAVQRVSVLISIPQLQRIEDDGDIKGRSVELQIQLQQNNGGFVTAEEDKIEGRTGDRYQKQYNIDLIELTLPIDIKIVRLSDDSTDPKKVDAFEWTSFTTINTEENSYPNCALVSLQVGAEQFSSVPKRMYRVRGIKVKIPHNATVRPDGSLAYSGTFDGTLASAQYTNDPCWCLYDLLTNSRYGLGDFLEESNLDKFSFYAASAYASALVRAGDSEASKIPATSIEINKQYEIAKVGNTSFESIGASDNNLGTSFQATAAGTGTGKVFELEPRFSLNVNIQSREESFSLVNKLSSVFRAMPFYSAGSIHINQDSPKDSSYLFTNANVIEGLFTYSGSSQKTRATVVNVKYYDMDLRDFTYVTVEDQALIKKYGSNIKTLDAFGCTSPSQARRVAKWLLLTEAEETETVTFSCSIEAGVIVRPGQVIEISDSVKAGVRRAGRIRAVSDAKTVITIDDTSLTDLPNSGTRTLAVVLPDGSLSPKKAVVDIVPGQKTIHIDPTSPFSEKPNVNSVWVLEDIGTSAAIQTSTWRVLSVVEQEETQYAITALAYNASKYANVEQGLNLERRDITNLNEVPPTPKWKGDSETTGITQVLYKHRDMIRVKILARWQGILGIERYMVRWRYEQGDWQQRDFVRGTDYEILDTLPGVFDFKIRSVNAAGVKCATALEGSFTSVGKSASPSEVTGFTASLDPHVGVSLSWNDMQALATADNGFADLDIVAYEIRLGEVWESSTVIATKINSTELNLPFLGANNSQSVGVGSFKYLIKAIDSDNNQSETAALATLTVAGHNAPLNITGTMLSSIGQIVIQWDEATGGSYSISHYRIKVDGLELKQVTATTFQTALDKIGNNITYEIIPVDIVGIEGTAGTYEVAVGPVDTPVVNASYSGRLLDLTWSEVSTPVVLSDGSNSSIRVNEYIVANVTDANNTVEVARTDATTLSISTTWNSSQTFGVQSIDVSGNQSSFGTVVAPFSLPAAPQNLSAVFDGNNVIVTWNAAQKGSLPILDYEVRRGDTSTLFANASVKIRSEDRFSEKASWSGTQRYFVVARDLNGSIGTVATVDATVVVPGPVGNLRTRVIDNNVLLFWEEPTVGTLDILHYKIEKGSEFIGNKNGLFTTVFEELAGTFLYKVTPVDTAGNNGSTSSINAIVDEPPDFILNTDDISVFDGTLTNAFKDGSRLLAPVNTTETWQQHFTSNGYATIQAQIDDGKDLYLLPSLATASYQEVVDTGATIAASKISVITTNSAIAGSPQFDIGIETSLNGTSYTSTASAPNAFANNFRYVRVTLNVTSSGGDDLIEFSRLNTKLLIKQKTDQGKDEVTTANSGKVVQFTKDFIDIDSINVTPTFDGATSSRIAVVDYKDVNEISANATSGATIESGKSYRIISLGSTNFVSEFGALSNALGVKFVADSDGASNKGTGTVSPNSFTVFLFDSGGSKVGGKFSWTCRGV